MEILCAPSCVLRVCCTINRYQNAPSLLPGPFLDCIRVYLMLLSLSDRCSRSIAQDAPYESRRHCSLQLVVEVEGGSRGIFWVHENPVEGSGAPPRKVKPPGPLVILSSYIEVEEKAALKLCTSAIHSAIVLAVADYRVA